MSRQLLHWRGRVPWTKALNPPPPVPSRGSCSKLERLIQQELNYLGLIRLQHQAPLYTKASFADQARKRPIHGHGISLSRHHMTSHEYYQCNTQRNIENKWTNCMLLLVLWVLGLRVKSFLKLMYWIPLFFWEFLMTFSVLNVWWLHNKMKHI